MHKRVVYILVVVACALLILSIVIEQMHFSTELPRPVHIADSARARTNEVSERHLTKLEVVLPGNTIDARLSEPNNASSKRGAATTEFGTSSSLAGAGGDSVIGRPFRVSASIQNSCKPNPKCDRIIAALKELEEEPRDDSWAMDMEAKLQDHLLSLGQDKYTIRAFECRESLCAIDAASTYGLLPFALPYGSPLDSQLSAWDSWAAHETNQLGADVTVTLLVYRRR
jgi:hypothetical protein